VTEVAVVEGTKRNEPVVSPVFRFQSRAGMEGRYEAVGLVPELASVLSGRGEDTGPELFAAGDDA
jgi:hypothetical protein